MDFYYSAQFILDLLQMILITYFTVKKIFSAYMEQYVVMAGGHTVDMGSIAANISCYKPRLYAQSVAQSV